MRAYARRYAQVCAHMRAEVMGPPPIISYTDQMRAAIYDETQQAKEKLKRTNAKLQQLGISS